MDARHVLAEHRGSDVLVHADARDLVVRAVGHLAVVGDTYLAVVGQGGLGDSLTREHGLRLGQSDAGRADAVAAGRVDQERPPAAADVEQPLALAQAELAADYVELALLRLLQRVVR